MERQPEETVLTFSSSIDLETRGVILGDEDRALLSLALAEVLQPLESDDFSVDVELLGSGGQANVYRVNIQSSNGQFSFVLKIFRSHAQVLLDREVFFTSMSPQIDLFPVSGESYFAMNCIEGAATSELLLSRNVNIGSRLRFVRDMVRNVMRQRGKSLFHRDIKPANTLVSGSKEPIFVDYALALLKTDLKNTGVLDESLLPQAGTPAYMAPERFRGLYYPPSDNYSVGRCLYDALRGTSDPIEMYRKALGKQRVSIEDIRQAWEKNFAMTNERVKVVCKELIDSMQELPGAGRIHRVTFDQLHVALTGLLEADTRRRMSLELAANILDAVIEDLEDKGLKTRVPSVKMLTTLMDDGETVESTAC